MYFISICIPSYNRPETLKRLLDSIDSNNHDQIEILIHEDKSPKRQEISRVVNEFRINAPYHIRYQENETNYGFDKNLRELLLAANGNWIVYMGDDDVFSPGSLDLLIDFLRKNDELGYVLKSHIDVRENGQEEPFKYFNSSKFFEPGIEAVVSLFRKSVFVSGFIIRKEFAVEHVTSELDGTLIFQLYILSEVALKHKSAYFDIPLTIQYDEGIPPMFGSSEKESHLYTPGTITIENSLNFLKGYQKVLRYVDRKHNIEIYDLVIKDMSKYFYPSLSIQRNKGLKDFFRYVTELNKLGFNVSIYYYIYVVFLTILGKNICDNGIILLKKILGKTPEL